MNTRLPMPWMSLLLFVGWLMLMGEVSLLALLGAALFAWLLPLGAVRIVPTVPVAGNPRAILGLIGVVIYDIVKSNIIVARLVLGDIKRLRPAFVTVPVQTDHPYVLNLLASIITMTPGTVSARVHESADGDHGIHIVVHVLDCEDADAVVRDIKDRYEAPLLEIFRCSRQP